MLKFAGKAGHRSVSSSPALSGSVLKSLFQKSVRRANHEYGMAAISFFLQILLDNSIDKHGKPVSRSNFTNITNRIAVILSEDLFDIVIIPKVCDRIGKLDKIRAEMDDGLLSEGRLLEAFAIFYEIVFLMIHAENQCRSVSYLKNAMKNMLAGKDQTKERVMMGGIDIISSFSSLIFDPSLYRKDGVSLKSSSISMIKEKVWKVILNMSPPKSKSAIKSLKALWERRAGHREHFVWILNAMLIVVDKDKSLSKMREIIYDISPDEAKQIFMRYHSENGSFKVPQWAIDKHSGLRGKEGLKRFLSQGIVMKYEYFLVPESYKKQYLEDRYSRMDLVEKKGEKKGEKNNLKDLPPSSVIDIESYVMTQLPCGGKPASFLVRSREGKNMYVKRCNQKPVVQLRVDAYKRKYRLKSNGFKYHESGFLICNDMGSGQAGSYPTKKYKGKTILDVENAHKAAVPVKYRLDKLDNRLMGELVKIGIFRFMMGASDSHMRNILYVPGDKPFLLSVDEMSIKVMKLHQKSLARSVFSKISKEWVEKIDDYVKRNRSSIVGYLSEWCRMESHNRRQDESIRLLGILDMVNK